MKNSVLYLLTFLLLFSVEALSQTQAPNIEWEVTLGGNGYESLQITKQTADGGYIIGGASESDISGEKDENSRGSTDYWVLKLDSLGTIEWQKTLGGASYDHLYSIDQTSDKGYLLGGESASNIGGDKTENGRGNFDLWLVKLDSIGVIQWQKTVGGNYYDGGTYLSQTIDGGFIVGATSHSGISGEKSQGSRGQGDYWVVKLGSDAVLSNSSLYDFSKNNNLKISPNPITESSILQIDGLRENAELNLKIISVSGATVHQISGSLSSINRTIGTLLMELPQGIYILQVTTPDGVRSVKVVR